MTAPGLYIHIPYCRAKCGYCAFYSTPLGSAPAPADYCARVLAHLRMMRTSLETDEPFQSLFIGGGTPTVYPGAALAELIEASRQIFSFVAHPEITVETNPNTCTLAALREIRAAGANRLSIGVQAFDDLLLAKLGRSHSRQEAIQAVHAGRQAGFANINLDLMYGLPGQGLGEWRQTLTTALAQEPEHLALYELSIEEGTPFAALAQEGRLALPDDDQVAEMAAEADALLAARGFERYEISNFARPGRRCLHNLNYWQNGFYVGAGAAAVSGLAGVRLANVADTELYMALVQSGRAPYREAEILSNAASFRESVIVGLRMLDGVSLAALQQRYGLEPRHYYGATLQRFVARGLVAIDQHHMRLTAKALPVANQVLSELV